MLNEIHLDAIDWNLLRVFEAMFQERSVVRCAERLNLSPSAVSHALNRLRHIFRDELFVRAPTGMRPTPRAEEIGVRMQVGLEQVRLALNPPKFEPAESRRRFHVSCTNYASTVLIPAVIERLGVTAPGIAMSVHPFDLETLSELDSGRLDLVIGVIGKLSDRFMAEVLFQDSFVWALRGDHPLAGEPLTLERLASVPRLVLSARFGMTVIDGVAIEDGPGRQVMTADSAEFRKALRGAPPCDIVYTITLAQAVPAIVGASNVAGLIPRRLAERDAAQYGLKLFEPPYPIRPFEHAMIWRRYHGEHSGAEWLRNVFRGATQSILAG